jgi:dolichol-phosphate mannosyltransferase
VKLRAVTVLRAGALGAVLARLVRAARTRAPVVPTPGAGPEDPGRGPGPAISVVIPARDESARIPAVLAAVVGAPGVAEVIVVDDESRDGTAEIAAAGGARVVRGVPPPAGWAGKTWALQQGLEAAAGEWLVTLDADTRPAPVLPRSAVDRAITDGTDLLTLAGRFDCPTRGARWLHAAMLTTLVYRFGPPGRDPKPGPERTMANGQCMVIRRAALLGAGGFEPVAGEVVEDVALARHLAADGFAVDFLDAADLLTVRMYESFADTWSGWGRSIALPGVEPRWRQIADLVTLAMTLPLPLFRVACGRVDPIDVVAIGARVGTLVGTRHAYDRADASYWSSPLADGLAIAALGLGVLRRTQTWRGRRYRL